MYKSPIFSKEIVEIIANKYSIPLPIKLLFLPYGYEITVALWKSELSCYVVKISDNINCKQRKIGIEFANNLILNNFSKVPNFINDINGNYCLKLDDNKSLIIYKYIEGMSYKHLSNGKFDVFVNMIGEYFMAKRKIAIENFEKNTALCFFPSPDDLFERFNLFCTLNHINSISFMDKYKLKTNIFKETPITNCYNLIHGDIRSRNLIWNKNGEMRAIIDFDHVFFAEDIIEFCILVRGVCFYKNKLILSRFLKLACSCYRISVLKYPASYIVNVLILVIFYFGIAINERNYKQKSPQLEFREFEMCRYILEYRKKIESSLMKL